MVLSPPSVCSCDWWRSVCQATSADVRPWLVEPQRTSRLSRLLVLVSPLSPALRDQVRGNGTFEIYTKGRGLARLKHRPPSYDHHPFLHSPLQPPDSKLSDRSSLTSSIQQSQDQHTSPATLDNNSSNHGSHHALQHHLGHLCPHQPWRFRRTHAPPPPLCPSTWTRRASQSNSSTRSSAMTRTRTTLRPNWNSVLSSVVERTTINIPLMNPRPYPANFSRMIMRKTTSPGLATSRSPGTPLPTFSARNAAMMEKSGTPKDNSHVGTVMKKWDDGPKCGEFVKLCYGYHNHCVVVRVFNTCTECTEDHIDLSKSAFKKLSPSGTLKEASLDGLKMYKTKQPSPWDLALFGPLKL